MTPSTIKTICTGIVLVAAAAPNGTGRGSLPGAFLSGTSSVPAEESKGSRAVDSSISCCMPMFSLLEVVLIEHTHALRAFVAVAQRIESVAVAHDHPPHQIGRAEGE